MCLCKNVLAKSSASYKHECDAEAGTNAHSGALDESVVLFGHDENVTSDAAFDLILLLGKLFIYVSRIDKTTSQYQIFKILYISKQSSNLTTFFFNLQYLGQYLSYYIQTWHDGRLVHGIYIYIYIYAHA